MSGFFGRLAGRYTNEIKRSSGALVGIVTGMLCDGKLSDEEIHFLNSWLDNHEAIRSQWPGDAIYDRVRAVLADGTITSAERDHLVTTLQQLVGGRLELAHATSSTELALDDVREVVFQGHHFCLTGDFVYAPRSVCIEHTTRQGGIISNGVTKKVRYLVVGGLGSPEWKHGSYGTKIEKAVQYRRDGLGTLIVHEDVWARSMRLGT